MPYFSIKGNVHFVFKNTWRGGQREEEDQVDPNEMEENRWVEVMNDCRSSRSKSKWIEEEYQSLMCLWVRVQVSGS